MMRYRTKSDRINEIKAALQTDNIYIMLLTVIDGNMTSGNYVIKHGNFSPPEEGFKASYDQFYITGEDEGWDQGFRNINDVQRFISMEIDRISDKRTQAIIDAEHIPRVSKWTEILAAWQNFQKQFQNAIKNEKIVTHHKAKEMLKTLYN